MVTTTSHVEMLMMQDTHVAHTNLTNGMCDSLSCRSRLRTSLELVFVSQLWSNIHEDSRKGYIEGGLGLCISIETLAYVQAYAHANNSVNEWIMSNHVYNTCHNTR